MSIGLQCVSETCEQPMDPAWAFCPACGTDNRRPADRTKVGEHYHRFINNVGYYLICGEPAGEPYMFGYKWRIGLAFACFSVSALSILAIVIFQVGIRMTANPLANWVNSWYGIEIRHYSRRYREYHYTSLGDEWTQWLILVAILTLIPGLMLLFKQPFSKREIWHDSPPSSNSGPTRMSWF